MEMRKNTMQEVGTGYSTIGVLKGFKAKGRSVHCGYTA